MNFLKSLFGGRKPTAPRGPLDLQQFAMVYARSVPIHFPGAKPKVELGATAGSSRVFWTDSEGRQANQFLGNAYDSYLGDPSELQAVIDTHIRQAAEIWTERDPRESLASILPVIKSIGWREQSQAQMRAAGAGEDNFALTLPWAGDLVIAYVEDLPDSMSYMTPRGLEPLGLDHEALHNLALENLTGRLGDIRLEGGGGRYAARLDRNYDASMVLLMNRWPAHPPLDGDTVLALPARDEVLLCGEHDAVSVATLREMALQIHGQAPYALSSQLYVWRDGGLKPLAA